MDLVDLMYKYINKFINSDELIEALNKIDLSKYSKEEEKIIKKLIKDIKNVKDKIPNEFDEVEKKRIEKIDHMLSVLENAQESDTLSDEVKKIIADNAEILVEDKNTVRDGGKLYNDIFTLLTTNSLVNKYAEAMDDEELLDFIAEYISAPLPPKLDQEAFDELVMAGIKKDKREALWRLAFNYNNENKDFSKIEDYFIEKKDTYYLVELVCAVKENMDLKKFVDKLLATKDEEFINKAFSEAKDAGLITDEEINKILDR